MKLAEHFDQAFINIKSAKLRSFLALLGILVGTAAVVALISCGQMATEKALAQFRALGTDLMAVTLFKKGGAQYKHLNDEMSLSEWKSLPEYNSDIINIAPYATAYQAMSFAGKELQGPIIGADESLADIIHIELAAGNFVSSVDTVEQFAIIGAGIAEQIKEITLDSAIGQQVKIGSALYSIIGVAKPWTENAFFNEDINRSVIVPVAGIALVNPTSSVNSAVILLKKNTPIDDFIANLKQQLEKRAPSMTPYVRSAKQIIASMESQGQIFTLLLGVIGGISLLVGGIGVMNVMLVAVSERKKEIGVRKAVGARNQDIQTLFLAESVIISLLGGGLGVLVGLAFSAVVAYFSQWPFFIHILPPLAGFVISVATGIFFGFYPARRAAQLEPIVSLRGD